MRKYIMALDSGTTSNRCILFDRSGNVCSVAQKEFTQHFPQPGWVEHDADEIFATQLEVARQALNNIGATAADIAAIGITNQRETTIVWEKSTGRPVCNAIVWQCRRTAPYCDALCAKGLTDPIREKTGLVIDPYFSGTKIRWILENVPGAREKAENGELLFGTVETWLIWKLTGGKVHVTDYSNASRTMLFNIHDLCWDEEILEELNIPKAMLPEAKPSSCVYGRAKAAFFGAAIPIIMGQNIGTCVTALLSSIGTNKNARRAAVVHLCFNIIGTILRLSISPSDILRITVTDTCEPELPPASISIGTKRTSTAGSADSKPVRIALDMVEEIISIKSQGIRDFQIENTSVLR